MSSFMYVNATGSGKSNGIDENNISEWRRQFMVGTIRASQKDKDRPYTRDPFQMAAYMGFMDNTSFNSGLYADNTNNAPRPLRDSYRIPILVAATGATIYACIGAMRQHLGMSEEDILALKRQYGGGLTTDILDTYSGKQIDMPEATYELDEAA